MKDLIRYDIVSPEGRAGPKTISSIVSKRVVMKSVLVIRWAVPLIILNTPWSDRMPSTFPFHRSQTLNCMDIPHRLLLLPPQVEPDRCSSILYMEVFLFLWVKKYRFWPDHTKW